MIPLFLLLAFAAGAFDVATVKRSPPPSGDTININLGTIRHGKVELTNATLGDCIKFAYALTSDEQISGPDWIRSKAILFDVVAQTSPDTPRDEVLRMTQGLLGDRLKLGIHHEQRELRYLALTRGKGGPKMRPVVTSESLNNTGGNGYVKGKKMSMLLLAQLLSRFEHQLVLDETGLSGDFEVNLNWTPDTGRPTANAEYAAGVSLFTALQEQLGLRLESRKGPVDVLVIDHAEQVPAEN